MTRGMQAKPWDIHRVNSLQSAQGANHEAELIEVLSCILVVVAPTVCVWCENMSMNTCKASNNEKRSKIRTALSNGIDDR